MKNKINRFLSLALAVVLCLGLFTVPASAESPEYPYQPKVDSFHNWGQAVADDLLAVFGVSLNPLNHWDQAVIPRGGKCTRKDLLDAQSRYNSWYSKFLAVNKGLFNPDTYKTFFGSAAITNYNPSYYNIWILVDNRTGAWITNSAGEYLYCTNEDWEMTHSTGDVPEEIQGGGTTPAQTPAMPGPTSTNQWLPVDNFAIQSKKEYNILSKSVLSNAVLEYCSKGEACELKQLPETKGKYVVCKRNPTSGDYYALSDSKGRLYAAVDENSVTKVDFDYIVNNNDNHTDHTTTVDNSKVLNTENNTFNIWNENGDEISYNIESLYYDESTKTYTVNCYDQTFNTTNNYYEYNYYTYNISYTYNNTYITYIGSNQGYIEPYEYYYELPDGRSSADLTEEEIAGMSFQFSDVLNYKRSATDTSLRALYHFDGDTEDSSFFGKQNNFQWTKGASIQYMDSAAFDGALYMDEKEHEFSITLPSGLGSKDFTLQWRYYQASATTTDHNENYLMVGDTKLLGWSEQTIYNGSGTKVGDLSVGSWQELALIRNGGTMYIYHNGIRLASASAGVLGNTITFHLGAASRAHSMIDEFRVTNFAIAEGGKAYTPTSVPYDTNSILVLPDGRIPVADEYWEWDRTIEPLFSIDAAEAFSFPKSSSAGSTSGGGRYTQWYCWNLSPGDFLAEPNATYVADGDTITLSSGDLPWTDAVSSVRSSQSYPLYFTSKSGAPFFALYFGCKTSSSNTPMFLSKGEYTLTVVGDDLTRYSVPITPDTIYSASASFSFGSLHFVQSRIRNNGDGNGYACYLLFELNANTDFSFKYVELVPGTQANTGHKKVTDLYDPIDLQPNTAAVQSTIPITGYTVGGVRPTFPKRGNVWFPVDSARSRITGVQIYTGQAWEEVGARWWTGSRWIPIYAFDIQTLADCWDVAGAGEGEIIPTITSESAFWNWWSKRWAAFEEKLFGSLGGSGPGGSGSGSGNGGQAPSGGLVDGIVTGVGDALGGIVSALGGAIAQILTAILGLVTDLLGFLFGLVTDLVVGAIGGLFTLFTGGDLTEFFQTVNEDGTTSVGLPGDVSNGFHFIAASIQLLPPEVLGVLTFGLGALVLISVFKMIKG